MTQVAESAGAARDLLPEKIALAWSIVHGFAKLMLDNALFAQHGAGAPVSALALVQRLQEMSQPAFALHALPAG